MKIASIATNLSKMGNSGFTITASISGANTATNYLKIELYKDGTTDKDFGETFNNVDWYGGSIYDQYLAVAMQSGITWGGTIQGRVGSPTVAQYDGSGVYKMRLRRYTSGGGSTLAEANNSAVTVSITLPTPTPTPTPTLTPTAAPTDTPTPTASPTNTPTPIPTATPVPITRTPTSRPAVSSAPEEAPPNSVLGSNTGNGLNISPPDNLIPDTTKKPDTFFQTASVIVGIIFIAICVILTLRVIKKEKLTQNEEQL